MLRFSGAAVSHPGLVRSGNEDAGFLGPTCMLVADGVGGAAAGEVAAATTAYAVSEVALADPWADPVTNLHAGVRLAQEQVATGVSRDPSRSGMATTLTAVVTDGSHFALAHVGDSRAYLVRDGRISRLTTDHTFVQRLIDQGTLLERDVSGHPWRNVVLRSINGDPAETADVGPLLLLPGDRVLVASDGLTDLVGVRRMGLVLDRYGDDSAAELLVEAALDAGGRDNITCLLATVVEGPRAVDDGAPVGALTDPQNVVDVAATRVRHSV